VLGFRFLGVFLIEKSNIRPALVATQVAMAPCDKRLQEGYCWLRTALPTLGPVLPCAGLLHYAKVPRIMVLG